MNTNFQDHCDKLRASARRVIRMERRGIGGLLAKTAAGTAVVTGVAIGYAASWGAAVAHAGTHRAELQYSCTAVGLGTQSSSFVLTWDSPDAVTVGTPTPPIRFAVTVQIPSFEVEVARTYEGYSSVGETGHATVTVTAPQEDLSRSVPFGIPSTGMPASGPLTVTATGTLPSFALTRPGVAKITVGAVTERVTPRDANGNPVAFGIVDETCAPESGRSVLLQSVQINPAPTPTHRHEPRAASPSPARPAPVTRPPSSVITPTPSVITPTPRTRPQAGVSGRDVALIGVPALVIAGAGGLVAWRLLRHRAGRPLCHREEEAVPLGPGGVLPSRTGTGHSERLTLNSSACCCGHAGRSFCGSGAWEKDPSDRCSRRISAHSSKVITHPFCHAR